MKKIIIYLIFSILLYGSLKTQPEGDLPYLNNIVPPSPEAVSLLKSIDFPVSYYTGTPSISIPIWTVQEKNLSIPISLSYNASGIKVEETASWVGLGWSLNAGGVVSRTVRGLVDEHQSGYFKNKGFDEHNLTNDDFVASANRTLDTEPDLFYYNFNGNSGKFVFDKNRNANPIPYNNIKIELIDNDKSEISHSLDNAFDFAGFKITTIDGTIYFFGTLNGTESSSARLQHGYAEEYNSSWYLVEVRTPDNLNNIKLEYIGDVNFVESQISETVKLNSYGNVIETNNNGVNPSVLFSGVRLSKIKTNNSVITFIDQGRQDANSQALKAIEVTNHNGFSKLFKFNYDYFFSNIGNTHDEMYRNRLKLESLTESSNDKDLEPYIFEYYETQILPPRLGQGSFAQDYWGYYNGKITNNTLIPTTKIGIDGEFKGADRDPSWPEMQACVLQKIIYPTKGYTEFYYKPHDFGHNRGKLVNINMVTYKTETMLLEAGRLKEFSFNMPAEMNIKIDPYIIYYDETFTKGYCTIHLFDAENKQVYFNKIGCEYNGISNKIECSGGYYDLIIPEGNYKLKVITDNTIEVGVTIKHPVPTGEIKKSIQIGGLRISEIKKHDGLNPEKNITIEYKYKMETDPERSSGVLIDFPLFSRLNKYAIYNGNSSSLKDYCKNVDHYWNALTTQWEEHILTNFPQAPLASAQGHPIGYREVEEITTGNGSTKYKFTSPFLYDDMYPYGYGISKINNVRVSFGLAEDNVYPFPPRTNFDWKTGLLKEKIVKREDELNNLIPIYHEENSYSMEADYNIPDALQNTIIGLKTAHVQNSILNTINLNHTIMYAFYRIHAGFVLKRNTKTTTFDINGNNPVITNTETMYNNTYNHLFPNEIITSNSNNKLITQKTYYPEDYSSNEFDNLIGNNIVSVPIDQRTIVDGMLTSGKLTKYNNNGQAIEVHVAEKELGTALPFDPNDPYLFDNPKLSFLYDERNNIIQYQKEDDIPVSIIWGYNNAYPVAKIINAEYTLIKSVLAAPNIDQINNNRLTDTDLNELLLPLYSHPLLQNAFVTTYTYDPLIGMTSSTDENNVSTFYEYDDYGRLIMIKDDDKNILQHHEYHYKDQ